MATKPAFKKFTEASDDKADRKAGIKESGKRDMALDKKRGIAEDKPKKGGKK